MPYGLGMGGLTRPWSASSVRRGPVLTESWSPIVLGCGLVSSAAVSRIPETHCRKVVSVSGSGTVKVRGPRRATSPSRRSHRSPGPARPASVIARRQYRCRSCSQVKPIAPCRARHSTAACTALPSVISAAPATACAR
ncbi:Uncharacterised protein [Mycobacteroides abscessus subsp. abscessus]|nr:Uncharacterised protein [Mycobacteroides abscessus subsp. abscessus]